MEQDIEACNWIKNTNGEMLIDYKIPSNL